MPPSPRWSADWTREATTVATGALAVHRLTKLVIDDRITEAPREALAARGGLVGYLVTCPWCVSVYAGAALAVALSSPLAPVARALAAGLAWSSATGLIAERE